MPRDDLSIPFLDLSRDVADLPTGRIMAALEAVVRTGRFIGGPPVERFEREFARFCGTAHAVGCGNGLDGLFLTLRALDIGAGDEVIVPAHTFIATWLAVSRTGATPRPVDVRLDTACIDPALIAEAVTERTKALIVVHLYGHVPDMSAIGRVASDHGIAVIEDAAQAHGAIRGGRMAGAFGHLAAFSFYPVKNLGAWGDAGAVTTDDPALADRVRCLADYGRSTRHEFAERGINSRLDPMQASVLAIKLETLEAVTRRRCEIAAVYDRAVEASPSLTRLLAPGENCVWHQYVVLARDRERVRSALAEAGIGTDVHYPVPPYRQLCYRDLDLGPAAWPVSDHLARSVLSLPIAPYLTDGEVDRVADAVSAV